MPERRRKSLCVDDSAGQKHLERGNLHRSQRTQEAEQHFIQEQEKGTQAERGMVSCGEYPRSDYLRRCVPTGAGSRLPADADGKRTAQRRFFRAGKIVRTAAGRWHTARISRTKPRMATIIAARTDRDCANAPCTTSAMMCFTPMSSPACNTGHSRPSRTRTNF